ncbi:MAG: cardiolipin synthase [Spirochaetes bacterium]|nr:cardiolipin synthase [Spirochaetota bacterium]
MNDFGFITFLYILNIIFGILVVIYALLNLRSPETAISWILVIYLLPGFGLLLFLLFGINWKKHRLINQVPEETFGKYLKSIIEKQQVYLDMLLAQKTNEGLNDQLKIIRMLLNSSNSILTFNNDLEVYHHGKNLFSQLLKDLASASHSIHMEYYIWRSDEVGEQIKEILIQKSLAGVKVKLIFDGVGSFRKISFQYRRELKAAGVEFKYFLDPLAVARLKINYRNHRKVVVIDGIIGYTGGMNIGSEYIHGIDHIKYWRDTHIRLKGNVVYMLQAIFLTDWFNSGNPLLIDDHFFPDFSIEGHDLKIQLAVSGPDSQFDAIENVYFTMITNANKSVLIQSPYFVPGKSMMRTLETTALSGVSVELMMTGIPDKRIPFWAAQTYFEELLRAGVKIYLYQKGFLHSKVVVADDLVASIGSGNMDARSFHLNYEINTIFYDPVVCQGLREQFLEDLKDCREVTLDSVLNTSLTIKLRNAICRLSAPLM